MTCFPGVQNDLTNTLPAARLSQSTSWITCLCIDQVLPWSAWTRCTLLCKTRVWACTAVMMELGGAVHVFMVWNWKWGDERRNGREGRDLLGEDWGWVWQVLAVSTVGSWWLWSHRHGDTGLARTSGCWWGAGGDGDLQGCVFSAVCEMNACPHQNIVDTNKLMQ